MSKRTLPYMAASIILTAGVAMPCFAQTDAPEIPSRASKPEGFVVEPWKINSIATGDLNRDGKPDAAIILSIGEGMCADQRKLVVVLKRKDGSYEKSAESDKATVLGCGPSGGIPSVEIEKNVLSVNHYCGSRERYEYLHKYQWRKGQWLLIGFTASTYDSLDPNSKQRIDVNTMTGEVSSTWTSGKGTVKERILELWAAPITRDEPSPSDWGAPAVHLNANDPKGAAAATLQAVHSHKKLFVKAQLDDDRVLAPEDVCLVDKSGHVISPEASRSTVYGYIVNSYDLHSGPLHELISKHGSNGNGEPVLRLSVDVKPHGSLAKMSTRAKNMPGAIFLSKNKGAPELKDVDVRDGDPVHPFLHYEDM